MVGEVVCSGFKLSTAATVEIPATVSVTTNIISFLFFITIVYDYIVSLFFYYYCNTSIPDCKGMHSFSVSLSYYNLIYNLIVFVFLFFLYHLQGNQFQI